MKKSCIFIILCLFVKLAYSDCYRAIDNKIKIRKEPNTKSKVLGQLFKDDEVYVYESKSTDEWFYCYAPRLKKEGYCNSKYFVIKQNFISIIDELVNDNPEYLNMISKNQIENAYIEDVFEKISSYSEATQLKIIKLAYENGCSLFGNSSTALIEAVRINNYLIVEYLLSFDEGKELLDVKHNMFARPLFYALYNGNEKIAELLLKNGADPSLTTAYSDSMEDMLQEWLKNGHLTKEKEIELKSLLEKYSCNIKIVPLEMYDFIYYPFKNNDIDPNRMSEQDFFNRFSSYYSIEGEFDKNTYCPLKVISPDVEMTYIWNPDLEEFLNVLLLIKVNNTDIIKRNISKETSVEELINIFEEKDYKIKENDGVTSLEYNINERGVCIFTFESNSLQEIFIIKDMSQYGIYYKWELSE